MSETSSKNPALLIEVQQKPEQLFNMLKRRIEANRAKCECKPPKHEYDATPAHRLERITRREMPEHKRREIATASGEHYGYMFVGEEYLFGEDVFWSAGNYCTGTGQEPTTSWDMGGDDYPMYDGSDRNGVNTFEMSGRNYYDQITFSHGEYEGTGSVWKTPVTCVQEEGEWLNIGAHDGFYSQNGTHVSGQDGNTHLNLNGVSAQDLSWCLDNLDYPEWGHTNGEPLNNGAVSGFTWHKAQADSTRAKTDPQGYMCENDGVQEGGKEPFCLYQDKMMNIKVADLLQPHKVDKEWKVWVNYANFRDQASQSWGNCGSLDMRTGGINGRFAEKDSDLLKGPEGWDKDRITYVTHAILKPVQEKVYWVNCDINSNKSGADYPPDHPDRAVRFFVHTSSYDYRVFRVGDKCCLTNDSIAQIGGWGEQSGDYIGEVVEIREGDQVFPICVSADKLCNGVCEVAYLRQDITGMPDKETIGTLGYECDNYLDYEEDKKPECDELWFKKNVHILKQHPDFEPDFTNTPIKKTKLLQKMVKDVIINNRDPYGIQIQKGWKETLDDFLPFGRPLTYEERKSNSVPDQTRWSVDYVDDSWMGNTGSWYGVADPSSQEPQFVLLYPHNNQCNPNYSGWFGAGITCYVVEYPPGTPVRSNRDDGFWGGTGGLKYTGQHTGRICHVAPPGTSITPEALMATGKFFWAMPDSVRLILDQNGWVREAPDGTTKPGIASIRGGALNHWNAEVEGFEFIEATGGKAYWSLSMVSLRFPTHNSHWQAEPEAAWGVIEDYEGDSWNPDWVQRLPGYYGGENGDFINSIKYPNTSSDAPWTHLSDSFQCPQLGSGLSPSPYPPDLEDKTGGQETGPVYQVPLGPYMKVENIRNIYNYARATNGQPEITMEIRFFEWDCELGEMTNQTDVLSMGIEQTDGSESHPGEPGDTYDWWRSYPYNDRKAELMPDWIPFKQSWMNSRHAESGSQDFRTWQTNKFNDTAYIYLPGITPEEMEPFWLPGDPVGNTWHTTPKIVEWRVDANLFREGKWEEWLEVTNWDFDEKGDPEGMIIREIPLDPQAIISRQYLHWDPDKCPWPKPPSKKWGYWQRHPFWCPPKESKL